jgi:hypothetical protein
MNKKIMSVVTVMIFFAGTATAGQVKPTIFEQPTQVAADHDIPPPPPPKPK